MIGGDHGKKSLLGTEEFVLETGEYVTCAIVYIEMIYGVDAPVIICLKFKKNKRTSDPYGLESGTPIVLEKKDHKIVGFVGQAGDYLYKLRARVGTYTELMHNQSDILGVRIKLFCKLVELYCVYCCIWFVLSFMYACVASMLSKQMMFSSIVI
ncbi:hypothetical protein Bca4012_098652 [Brassica carinata]|uniref:Jacalin-type lectin domain-containing protein n=1 Tax=Brassica oleracea var. oleracea TaxID=109376 RepID=A0A0D3CRZ3_BRAOL|nr:PREDICTED: jacalin-related lectin 35-like [Brassica oleracea var. oleracea]